MAKITYISHDGTERTVEAKNGESVMEAAIKNSIPGIDADCGGACACATCHVYVDPGFADRLDPPGPNEAPLLEFLTAARPTSRLACQIVLTPALDGLTVETPRDQGG